MSRDVKICRKMRESSQACSVDAYGSILDSRLYNSLQALHIFIYIYIHVLDEFFTFPLKFSKVYISFCRIFSRKAAEFSTSVGWVLALSSVLEGCALAVWSQCGNRRMTMWRSFLVDPFQIATTWVSGKSWIYQPWRTSTGFFKTSW